MTNFGDRVRLTALTVLSLLTSCDPVHSLKLENKTSEKIEVLFYPDLDNQELGDKETTKINFNGRELNTVTLDSAETIRIGTVTARYNPRPDDVDLDYLEVRMQPTL